MLEEKAENRGQNKKPRCKERQVAVVEENRRVVEGEKLRCMVRVCVLCGEYGRVVW